MEKEKKREAKYRCELCNFNSHDKTKYLKHLDTKKHTKTKEDQKKTAKYCCELCNFYSNNKTKFDHHLATKKHKKVLIGENGSKSDADFQSKLINTLKEELHGSLNEQFETKLVKTLKELLPQLALTNNITNNITNNNRISNNQINIFLNEKCADAISIQEFAKQLAFTIDDVFMKKHDALVSVINKNLDPLAMTERPVHCTNVVRRKWHVKDETDGWKKDDGGTLVREVNNSLLKNSPIQYTETFPNWMDVPKRKDEFVKIVQMTSSDMEPKAEARVLTAVSGLSQLDLSK